MQLEVEFTGNTSQAVTVEAYFSELTSVKLATCFSYRPLRLPYSSRGVVQSRLNRGNSLGAVLNAIWLGSDLSGQSIGQSIVVTPPTVATIVPGSMGRALASSSGTVFAPVAFPNASKLPYLQVCLGYFSNVGASWRLSGLGEIADSHYSLIRINNSVSIQAGLRFSGGTAVAFPLTVGSGVSSGLLICAILQVFSATDYRLYANGVQANGSTDLR